MTSLSVAGVGYKIKHPGLPRGHGTVVVGMVGEWHKPQPNNRPYQELP